MKNFSTVLLILLQAKFSFAQLTLEQCQQKARMNYPAIKQFDLIEKSKDYNLKNASNAYYPQLSVTGIGGYIIQGFPKPPESQASTNNFQLIGIAQLNQTIWDGGVSHAQKEVIRANAVMDSVSNDVSLYSLNDRVNQLYFGILLIDEQLKQLDQLKENLQRSLNAAELAMQNGAAYQSDVDEVKVEIVKADQKQTEFSGSRKAYIEMLSELTGTSISSDASFEMPQVVDTASLFTIHRPEMQLYESQRRVADAQVKAINANYYPKFGLLGAGLLISPGVAFGGATVKSLALAGISLSWNTGALYRGGNDKQLSKINLDKIENQQEIFLFNTNLQISQAKNDLEKQQALLKQDDEIVSLKESIRKAYELKYQNGISSMNDLLNAESGESDAQSTRALHEVQELMSLYNLKTISGN